MESQTSNAETKVRLTKDEKTELLRLARAAIQRRIRGELRPTVEHKPGEPVKEWGAFVTLHKQGMLRGCIGSLEGRGDLKDTIVEMAESAAFQDPRFMPLSEDELPYTDIEISVLTPMEPVKDTSDIEVGRHGLMVQKGPFSGLLLPQVASERNWDRTTFLNETCRKAGLPKDAWKDEDTRILMFSAEVFDEHGD
jgi:AmmeMemoRadiSam system protein A